MQRLPQTLLRVLRALLVLIALLALLIAYYWVHKPLDLALAGAIGGMALDLASAALIVGVAGGVGRIVMTRVDDTMLSRGERIALEAGLGLSLLSVGVLIAGLIGLFTPPVFWIAVLSMAALSVWRGRGWFTDCRDLVGGLFNGLDRWTILLAAFCALILSTALLRALAPPTAWDALTYHLVEPTRYLADGRITAQPDNPFFGMAQGTEMLFGVAIGLFGRVTAAAPLHWLIGVLSLIGLGGLIARVAEAGKTAAWLAVTLILSGFSVWLLFGQAYVDLAPLLYGTLILIALVCWQQTRRTSWLILTGILLGMAVSTKYTAAALGVSAVLYVIRYARAKAALPIAIMAGAAFVVFAPWLVKGALLYGNPIYPYVFGGVAWDIQRTRQFNLVDSTLLSDGNAWKLPILPIAATVFGAENGTQFSFTMGPWLLTLPLLLILSWRTLEPNERTLAKDALLIGAPLLIFWGIAAATSGIGIQTRLVTMAFPLFALCGSLALTGMSRWPTKPLSVYFILQAMLVLSLLLESFEVLQTSARLQTAEYALALVSHDDFLSNTLGTYIGAMHELDTLPAGSRVRFLWEPRGFYCPPHITCIADSLIDAWTDPLANGQTPDQIMETWSGQNDGYVLLFDTGYQFSMSEDVRFRAQGLALQSAIARWLTPVWTDGYSYTLYRFNYF